MKFLLSLLFTFSSLFLASQEVAKYNLEEVATIEVPAAMELQSKAYQQAGKAFYDQFNFIPVAGRAVFQQAGVNELDKAAMALYTRVIHETNRGSRGDFPTAGTDPGFSLLDLQEIDESMKQPMMKPQPMGLRVTKWLGTKLVKLNGQYALHVAYERQMENNPVVRVDRYSFFNDDRLQVLTMSYRISEAARWKPIHERILDSYRIVR